MLKLNNQFVTAALVLLTLCSLEVDDVRAAGYIVPAHHTLVNRFVRLAARQSDDVPEMLSGKTYRSGQTSISFRQNGTFRLRGHALIPTVEGRFSYEDGVVTFSDPTEDVSGVAFPVRCRIEASGKRLVLNAVSESCAAFDGLRFDREE